MGKLDVGKAFSNNSTSFENFVCGSYFVIHVYRQDAAIYSLDICIHYKLLPPSAFRSHIPWWHGF